MLHEKCNKVLTDLFLILVTLVPVSLKPAIAGLVPRRLPQTLPHVAGGPAGIQPRHLQTHTLNRPIVPDRRFHTTPSLPVRFPSDISIPFDITIQCTYTR